MAFVKFFVIVTLMLLYVNFSFQAATGQRDSNMLESHDDVEFDGHRPHEVNPSDIVLNRKKRQQQMTNFDFFHHCLQNIEVAELQPLDSTPIQKNKVTRLEADDDDAETVTTFDEYLREKEKKAKDRLKHPKNPKGFVNDEGEDDDGDD